MKLHGYFRSSASYRVRIALNLKGLACEHALVRIGNGEQFGPGYAELNRQGLVPTLEDDGLALTQSLAIVEYLEECHPEPPLLPADAGGRARVRAIALAVACEIQPLNNTRVLAYLSDVLDLDQGLGRVWSIHWIELGFGHLEKMLARSPATGGLCHGNRPTLADVCLVPQVYNARRLDLDLGPYPTLVRIEQACLELPAFAAAVPENQPDAEAW